MATRMVCKECGSDNVTTDAAARWSGDRWEVSTVYDNSNCQNCEAEGDDILEEVELEPAPDAPEPAPEGG